MPRAERDSVRELLEVLLRLVRSADPDELADRVLGHIEQAPEAADRVLTGLVLVVEGLSGPLLDDGPDTEARPAPASRYRIPVRDDDAGATTRRRTT